ncbi:hypothetical protein M758_2G211300 [Ceratodon purpureus]|nr:hypothetical protein M758_2G211300 [Ceratodon purpureus]
MTVPPQICRMQKAMGMMVRMVEQMMVVERIVEETRTSASLRISITSYFEVENTIIISGGHAQPSVILHRYG